MRRREPCQAHGGVHRHRPTLRRTLVAALVLVAAVPVRADENEGLRLLREARRLAADPATRGRARDAIQAARVEMPGSALVAHALGDLNLDEGDFRGATDEYLKGQTGPYRFRSYFNQAVARHAEAESGLAEAGVPLKAAQLPEGAPAQSLLPAIDAALPLLERARGDLMEALGIRSDAAARESVAAINRRIDELLEMKRRLEEQQEQEQEGEDESQDDEQEPEDQDENQDDQDQPGPDDQQQDQDGQEDGQPEDQQQDDPQEDQPEPDDQDQQEQDQQDQAAPEQRPLTPAELQELLDQLEDLEEQALRLARERRARERESPEKDW